MSPTAEERAAVASPRQPPRRASIARLLVGTSVGWLGISMIADGLPALVLPYRLSAAGVSEAAPLGLVTLVAIALAALVQPFAGRRADIHGPFPVLVVGVIVAGGGIALLVAPMPAEAALAGVVVALVGAGVAQAAVQPLLPRVIPSARRGLASGAKGAFDVGGALLGFVVLAALLGSGNLAAAGISLVVALAGGALAAYLLIGRRRLSVPARAPDQGIDESRRAPAFSISWTRDRPLIALVGARFLYLLGIFAVGRFLLLFIGERWSLAAEAAAAQAGVVLAVLAALTVLASPPAGWLADRFGRAQPMRLGGVITAVGIAFVPLAGGVVPLIVAGSLIAFGSALFGTASWARLTDLVTPSESGRMLGLAHLGTAAAAAGAGGFGLLIDAGRLSGDQAGYTLVFAIAAVCALVGGVGGGMLDRRASDAIATQPAPEVAR